MSATAGDFGHAAQIQFVRAQKAEQKAEDIQHALNLVLNLGFERFHPAATADGAVHTFELGIVRDLPAPEGIDLPPVPKSTRNRRMFSGGRHSPKDIFTPQHSTNPNSGRSPSIRNREMSSEVS
jgi:hypothetical protein